ncbi:hypothetical protein N7G274_000806 [Stereocaulon virgatum]|uniref:Uncharacterized protein n=1 Tax=Stereocaulon virgatum TaxID=373712 RepID=A0ABR4ANU4_9LECA
MNINLKLLSLLVYIFSLQALFLYITFHLFLLPIPSHSRCPLGCTAYLFLDTATSPALAINFLNQSLLLRLSYQTSLSHCKAAVDMLVLPMRSPEPSPSRQSRDTYTSPLPASHRESSPQTFELRRQLAGAMLSVMPSTTPSAPKRPKLSLQTSIAPTLATSTTESPTLRNTKANSFEGPPPTPSSTIQPQIQFPSFPTTLAPSSATHSPYSHDAPYILPIGTHSILRNSPLPKRLHSATSARGRRMFPPVKRVSFKESLVEVAPIPVIDDASDDEAHASSTEEEHRRRREIIKAQDGHATPIHGKRKRRRDWVWRPMEDDVLASYRNSQSNNAIESAAWPLPAPYNIENVGAGVSNPLDLEDSSSIREASSSQDSERPKTS